MQLEVQLDFWFLKHSFAQFVTFSCELGCEASFYSGSARIPAQGFYTLETGSKEEVENRTVLLGIHYAGSIAMGTVQKVMTEVQSRCASVMGPINLYEITVKK